jgi:hypothetical protein
MDGNPKLDKFIANVQTGLRGPGKVVRPTRDHLELKVCPHLLKCVGELTQGSDRLPSEQWLYHPSESLNRTEIHGT